ncbi:MAG: SGNH/GDSL hydrolase family protein [Candidatus Omnitrophica bacterium]|jgi:lysophospholipase L1-like esterase|nr:SGNH/GDSL hydrolase family protein [Candidatus Omnitrophota bacterium]
MKRKFKAYIKSAIFVTIVSLIALELALFVSGKYLLWQRRTRRDVPGTIRIVCLGDSHTFGVGTSMRYSYPEQLARLLALNNHQQRFSILNLGIPGASTKRQAQELKLFLKEHGAEAVILLTGRNNDSELKGWMNNQSSHSGQFRTEDLKILRFIRTISAYFRKKDIRRDSQYNRAYEHRYSSYLNFYLEEIRKLCQDKGAKLILLSYYNSSDNLIKDFSYKYNIPYLDFTPDFESLFKIVDSSKYISPDMSHLNRLGYKFFAEQLYGDLFLKQTYLGFQINPLLREISQVEFYPSENEIKQMITLQEERIEHSRSSTDYPFELVHLGHIYMEIGQEEAAGDCYRKALTASGYLDNNTIVSPIINWNLKKGRSKEALDVCKEVLLHNPGNSIAERYRDWLISRGY